MMNIKRYSIWSILLLIGVSLVPAPKADSATQYYAIINLNSDKALDVGGSKTNNGANVNIWEYDGGKAQQWRLKKVD
jgi:hypothetical protein